MSLQRSYWLSLVLSVYQYCDPLGLSYGRNIKLDFKGVENYPDKFTDQMMEPFNHKKKNAT